MREAPTYTALSYSWTKDTPWKDKFWEGLFLGQPLGQTYEKVPKQKYQEANEIIICDGNVTKITQSLYDALLQLRKRPPQEYWIDALCINQADDEERSSQVQMMGHIYREAELVLVWLGTVPLGLSRRHGDIEWTLPEILAFISDEPNGFFKGHDGVRTLQESISQGGEVTRALLALGHLLSRRYFRRLWVIQETALSKKVTFLLGEQSFGPETFFKVVEFINSPLFTRAGRRAGWLCRASLPHWTAQFASMPLSHPSQPAETDLTGTWSLHKWLETCIGRKASDDKDLAFAGLSLVQPDLLQIRQSLQLSEASQPPLPPRPLLSSRPPVYSDPPPLPPRPGVQAVAQTHHSPSRGPGDVELWPQLRADYSASRHEVLLNLAACVLSGPDPTALLSISSRYRARRMSASSSGYNPILAPSWVPALAPWTILQHKIKFLGDYGVHCSAAIQVQNDFRISSDGSTLLLSATRLGSVQKRLVPPRIVRASSATEQDYITAEEILELMKEISTSPTSYRDTGQSYPAALASASTWGLHGRDQLASQDAILGFCLALDKDFNDAMSNLSSVAQMASARASLGGPLLKIKSWAHLSKERQEYAQPREEKMKQELSGAYETLKKAYPNLPWATNVALPRDGMKATSSEEETRLLNQYSSSCMLELVLAQRLFTTDTGYVGQTMTGVETGDEVVLVHGASVPYIFRRVDKAIRAEVEELKCELQIGKAFATDLQKYRDWMQDLEGQLGMRDGWVVVGEAYVEGVMNGEAVSECFKRAERFSLV